MAVDTVGIATLVWTIGVGVVVAAAATFAWVIKVVYTAGLTLKGIEKDLQALIENRDDHKKILDDHEDRLRHVENVTSRFGAPTVTP
jgi:hypothetical protein